MRSIGVRELRQNAGLYLRDVQQGETIEITHHGHPIAQLIPATNDAWSALIASKEVIAARTHPRDILARPPRAYDVNDSTVVAGR
jgi:prevent-host-death family protein